MIYNQLKSMMDNQLQTNYNDLESNYNKYSLLL
jgi:hypothetical protein